MSFAIVAIMMAEVSRAAAMKQKAEARAALGLPPEPPPPPRQPEPMAARRPSDDLSPALMAGVFGYAMGSSHSHQDTSSPSYDSGSSCTPSTSDSFSSGGGGDFGGGGATGDW